MARTRVKVAAALAALGVVGGAGAAVAGGGGAVGARLDGYQEVPAVSTDASGRFAAQVSARGQEIRYRLRYSDTESPVLQAHIHFAQRSVNGGIAVFLCTNLGNGPAGTQPCPADGGVVTGTITPEDVIGPADRGIAAGEFDELLDAIRAGATYVNVHTQTYPAGEIRGQLRGGGGHHRH